MLIQMWRWCDHGPPIHEQSMKMWTWSTDFTSRSSLVSHVTDHGSSHIIVTSLKTSRDRALSLHALHVVSRQHPSLVRALDRPKHPSLVDGLAVDDDVSLLEAHFVVVLSVIVVHRLISDHLQHGRRNVT